MLINRDNYLQQLISARGDGMIKILTGVRRCGKSFLLFTLFRNWNDDDGILTVPLQRFLLGTWSDLTTGI